MEEHTDDHPTIEDYIDDSFISDHGNPFHPASDMGMG